MLAFTEFIEEAKYISKANISVRLPEDLHLRVKAAAPSRKKTIERAYEEALEAWLCQPSSDNPPTTKADVVSFGHSVAESKRYREVFASPANARLLNLFTDVLASGNEDAIGAVTSNLEVFSEYATLKGRSPAPLSIWLKNSTPTEQGVFKIDTATGETWRYIAGQDAQAKPINYWSKIDQQ